MNTVQYKGSSGAVLGITDVFHFPLTLAFIQFSLMAIAFFVFWIIAIGVELPSNMAEAAHLGDKRWPTLVGTHVFSTFWLQSLMMPGQMMSLGVFAASRAIEIPAAAILRSTYMGTPWGPR